MGICRLLSYLLIICYTFFFGNTSFANINIFIIGSTIPAFSIQEDHSSLLGGSEGNILALPQIFPIFKKLYPINFPKSIDAPSLKNNYLQANSSASYLLILHDPLNIFHRVLRN